MAPSVSPETSDLLHDPRISGGPVPSVSGETAPELVKALLDAGVDVVARFSLLQVAAKPVNLTFWFHDYNELRSQM